MLPSPSIGANFTLLHPAIAGTFSGRKLILTSMGTLFKDLRRRKNLVHKYDIMRYLSVWELSSRLRIDSLRTRYILIPPLQIDSLQWIFLLVHAFRSPRVPHSFLSLFCRQKNLQPLLKFFTALSFRKTLGHPSYIYIDRRKSFKA